MPNTVETWRTNGNRLNPQVNKFREPRKESITQVCPELFFARGKKFVGIRSDGVYAVFRTPTGAVVILPAHPEDSKKLEQSESKPFTPLVGKTSAGVSGGVDEGETPAEAVVREIKEELDLRVSKRQISNGLPPVFPSQVRGGKLVNFTAAGFEVHLLPWQVEKLRNSGASFVFLSELLSYLDANLNTLRPAWLDALYLYLISKGLLHTEEVV